jgi:lipopolysaccharide/colanic/teichoic acid biosynthesis glycosyltransferase
MYEKFGKRGFDIVISLIGITLLLPVFVVIALVILVWHGQPVLFRQSRVGRNRQNFKILKFRTMSIGEPDSDEFEAGNISRIMSIGSILRRTKLDELPQFLNVLRGDMSLVGPRPEVRSWTQIYESRWDQVLSVRPGITDWAAIEFKNEELLLSRATDSQAVYRDLVLPKKLDHYEKYVANVGIREDFKILFFTVVSLFK